MAFTWKDKKDIFKGEGIYHLTFTVVNRVPLDSTLSTDAPPSYDCGNGANTLFSPPFIRTLARRGQLNAMLRYVHANPDNAWLRHQPPELYVIRRRQRYAGLLFDTVGKTRLLDYPDRHVVALSRSLTDEQIAAEVSNALRLAESGTVTYTAAINKGEKMVARAVREAGYPLVVMMLDGFPAEGTEAARYYHPLPRTSQRWRMIAGNVMLRIIAEENNPQ